VLAPGQAADSKGLGVAAICVFCSGTAGLAPTYLALADEAGRRIGEQGHSLVYGGGGNGMMGAVARAARIAGAAIVGITTRRLVAAEQADDRRDDLIVSTDLGARKSAMIEKADAFLVLPGGLGTLDELFEVWTTGPQLGQHDKPIVLVNAGGFYTGLIAWLRDASGKGVMHPDLIDALIVTTSVEEAMERIG
jgi:uncharacterized protein (TIGR00730 family)